METTNEAAPATPKDNIKTQKNVDIAVIILVVLLILTAVFAVYEHLLRIDAENIAKHTTTETPEYIDIKETPTPNRPQLTPEESDRQTSKQDNLSKTVKEIFDAAVTESGTQFETRNDGYSSSVSFLIKPKEALTSFSTSTYYYTHSIYAYTSDEDAMKKFQSTLEAELYDRGFESIEVFYVYDEGTMAGFVNNTSNIICEPINYTSYSKYAIDLTCVDTEGFPLYSETMLKEYNKKAEAYKKVTKEYPLYIGPTEYGVSLYGDNGKEYYIVPKISGAQIMEYFYQEWGADDWKFAGTIMCESDYTQNAEEKALFKCLKPDGIEYYSLGIRGNF